MIDAIIECVEDALRNGDEISIKGFGNLHLHKRAARRTKQPGTDKWFDVEERLVPKFDYGTSLKMAARSYELLMKERMDAKYIENLYIEQCFDESDLDDSMSDIMSVGEIE